MTLNQVCKMLVKSLLLLCNKLIHVHILQNHQASGVRKSEQNTHKANQHNEIVMVKHFDEAVYNLK